MSTAGAHVRPEPLEALPRECRRSGDLSAHRYRHEAVRHAFDEATDRRLRGPLTLADVEAICRDFEARFRALGGAW